MLHFKPLYGDVPGPHEKNGNLGAELSNGPVPGIKGSDRVTMLLIREHDGDWQHSWRVARVKQ